jgi:hypothetical protein
MPLRGHRPFLFGFLVLVWAWMALEALSGGHCGLLYLAPALLLCAPLLRGRYVGEGRLAALAGRPPRPRWRAVPSMPAPRTSPRPMLRGGRLVAAALAERPPPSPLTSPSS